MSAMTRWKIVETRQKKSSDIISTVSEKIMLQLARILIVAMLSAFGFLLNGYIESINATLDKISDTEERLTVMVARMDETIRSVDQRLDRIENKKP